MSARSSRDGGERENAQRAVEYIGEAADGGARIICFPEGYPGPDCGPIDFSPLPALQEAASEADLYVVASLVERVEGESRELDRLMLKLIAPDGSVSGSYASVLPNPREMPDYLMAGKTIVPDEELPVFHTEHGCWGCSCARRHARPSCR